MQIADRILFREMEALPTQETLLEHHTNLTLTNDKRTIRIRERFPFISFTGI